MTKKAEECPEEAGCYFPLSEGTFSVIARSGARAKRRSNLYNIGKNPNEKGKRQNTRLLRLPVREASQ
ncbi:MAG: hypothetical protein ACP5QS_06990 [bacterium]